MNTGVLLGVCGAAASIAMVLATSGPTSTFGDSAAPPDQLAGLPPYQKVEGVSGTLRCAGSTTIGEMVGSWGDSFEVLYPGTSIKVTTGGSAIGPESLISGTSDLAAMSRRMTDAERSAFQSARGYAPTEVTVALDALVIYVNKDNPARSLSLKQLDSIFSTTFKRGGSPIELWSGAGIEGDIASMGITRYGFNANAGGYSLFQEVVLQGGEFRSDIDVQPGSSGIVNAIGANVGAIGYASQASQTRRTRAVPVSADDGGTAVDATRDNCIDGSYSLSRRLYLYLDRKPGAADVRLAEEFVMYALSKDGQRVVAEDFGNFALTPALAAEQRGLLGR